VTAHAGLELREQSRAVPSSTNSLLSTNNPAVVPRGGLSVPEASRVWGGPAPPAWPPSRREGEARAADADLLADFLGVTGGGASAETAPRPLSPGTYIEASFILPRKARRRWGPGRARYVVRASELTLHVLVPGPSLALNPGPRRMHKTVRPSNFRLGV
jgi:hypothetical protein